jgi:hypothetical protein
MAQRPPKRKKPPRDKKPGRHIPTSVQRQLRQETGFVCAEPDCVSPYVTYHHFDPPYRGGQTHEPAGMIPLCLEHHKAADHGAYSDDDLREWKASKHQGPIDGGFAYRGRLVTIVGNSVVVDANQLITIHGEPVVWFTQDEKGDRLLNLEVQDATLRPVFSMRDNRWTVAETPEDLVCPPSAKDLSLRVPSLGVSLDIRFERKAKSSLAAAMHETFDRVGLPATNRAVIETIPDSHAQADVIICTLLATMPGVAITGEHIKVGRATFSRMVNVASGGIRIDSSGVRVG